MVGVVAMSAIMGATAGIFIWISGLSFWLALVAYVGMGVAAVFLFLIAAALSDAHDHKQGSFEQASKIRPAQLG